MKEILTIDVPVLDDGRHLCNECPIWNKEHCSCQYDFNTKANGCPLKPFPETKDVGYPNDDYDVGFGDGWDACLKEITGETE